MSERSEKRYFKKLEQLPERRERKTIIAIAGLLCVSSLVTLYNVDADRNEALASLDEISLEPIQDNGGDSALIFGDGFNTTSADYLASKLGPAVLQISDKSDILSLHTENTAPNPRQTANVILDYTTTYNKDHLSLFGYSLSGNSILKTVPEIQKNPDAPVIDIVYLGSMPDSVDSLRPDKQALLEGLTTFLANTPRSERSSYIKFLVTLGFHKEDYMPGNTMWESLQNFNPEAFSYQWDDAYRTVTNRERPDLSILEQQINLARSDIRKDMEEIAKTSTPETVPTIVYLKISNPGTDAIVNNDIAAENVCNAAKDAGVPCIIVEIAGGQHAEYYTPEAVQAYTDALASNKSEILASVDSRRYRYGPVISEAGSQESNFPFIDLQKDDPK